MQNPGARKPATNQTKKPSPGHRAALTPSPEGAEPVPKDLTAEDIQAIHVARHRVVVEPALHHRAQPLPELWDWRMPPVSELRLQRVKLRCETFADRLALDDEPAGLPCGSSSSARVFRVIPLMCVNPRKSNVSGLPSPRRFRCSAAWRPNSIRRVLSGWSSNPNDRIRSLHSSRNRSASARCSNPRTMSSAYRTTIMSPVAERRRHRRTQRSNT